MRRLLVALAAVGLATTALATSAAAGHGRSQGGLGTIVSLNARNSGNWFGYGQGTLEKNVMFHGVTGDFTVPTASAHTRGENEFSSTWVGIGGGCVNPNCSVTDNTLIQAGTEQDVDSSGNASYSAWWEVIPAPSVTISTMSVAPGDRIHVDIHETAPEVWSIALNNLSNGQTFQQTMPYTSSYATAEWIEETPLIVGTNPFNPLPNLSPAPNFDLATITTSTGGTPQNPGLTSSEEIQLTDSNNQVIGAPSAPDPDTDGFNACAWASSCSAPASS